VLSIKDNVVGIHSLIGYALHGMLSLTSLALSIPVSLLMLLLHLWLTPFFLLFPNAPTHLPISRSALPSFVLSLCLLLSLPLWFQITW
jgi:hypothetical protein